MTMQVTPLTASRRVLKFAREGRLIQRSWHDKRDGKEFACLLGAMHKDIDSVEACPASLMPDWVASLCVELFDSQTAKDAFAWAERIGAQMGHRGWSRIDWPSIKTDFLIAVMAQALESARPSCGKEAYWPQVERAHALVREALRGKGDLQAAMAAAWAAARAAAGAAARAAAWAAAGAAARAAAREAAWAAARTPQAAILCDLIDARLA